MSVRNRILLEKSPRNFAAYAPDLPGCVATGDTRVEIVREMRSAIALHIESLRGNGERVPEPHCTVATVNVGTVD